jgi:hypothetical protein
MRLIYTLFCLFHLQVNAGTAGKISGTVVLERGELPPCHLPSAGVQRHGVIFEKCSGNIFRLTGSSSDWPQHAIASFDSLFNLFFRSLFSFWVGGTGEPASLYAKTAIMLQFRTYFESATSLQRLHPHAKATFLWRIYWLVLAI